MRDPDFDVDIKDQQIKANRGSEWNLLRIAIVMLLGLVLLNFPFFSRRRYSCAACGLRRIDHSLLGFTWPEFNPNECSRWYDAHVERTHEHVWAKFGHCRRIGIPFLSGGFACNVGDRIAGFSPSWQLEVYRHFPDPLEAKRLFVDLRRWDGRLMDAMGEWAAADFPGTWEDWWASHRGKEASP